MEIRGMAKILGDTISKNSPTILTGVAVAGLVTTTILSIRATPKAIALIEGRKNYEWEEHGSKSDYLYFPDGFEAKLKKGECIKVAWKCYIPAACVGAITIACIIGSNHISLRRNAALASIYGITEAAFKDYRAKVVETIGKNKELKIRDDIAKDEIKRNPPGTNEIIFTGKGEVMCYDSLSGRYFKSDIEQIRRAVNDLNRDLLNEMFVTVNELYEELGLSGTALGDKLGWDVDKGMIEVNFSTQLTDKGEPCLVLNYDIEPKFMK